MFEERFVGKPINEIIVEGESPELTILLIIDGCRADSLYQSLDSNKLPRLSRMLNEMGYVRSSECVTVFPSVTITCHASIMTGSYPIVHGIVGNNWFIRKKWMNKTNNKYDLRKATREYIQRSWWHHKSDPGLANGYLTGNPYSIANNDLHRKMTLYEAHNKITDNKNLNVFEMIWRGVATKNPYKYMDLIDLDNFFDIFGSRKRKNAWLDESCIESIIRKMDADNKPALIVGWVPGMDGHSHKFGPRKQRPYLDWKGKDCFDCLMGDLYTKLKKTKLLKNTMLIITADHGQYPSDEKNFIKEELIYMTLARKLGENVPLKTNHKIDLKVKHASIVVMANGGMCQVYVSNDMKGHNWDDPPGINRIKKIASTLEKNRKLGIDIMFARTPDGKYNLFRDNQFIPLTSIDSETYKYPLLRERITGLNDLYRAGDILISARKGYYYARKSLKGEHGTLSREDSIVPLIFAGKGVNASTTNFDKRTRIIDIAPTIGKIMGFLTYLNNDISEKTKLEVLENSLSAMDVMDSELEKYRKGRYRRVPQNSHRVQLEDLRENIERTRKETTNKSKKG